MADQRMLQMLADIVGKAVGLAEPFDDGKLSWEVQQLGAASYGGRIDLVLSKANEILDEALKKLDGVKQNADLGKAVSNLQPGEPSFVLKGRDCLAVRCLEGWWNSAHDLGVSEEKLQSAMEVLESFRKYRPRKLPD